MDKGLPIFTPGHRPVASFNLGFVELQLLRLCPCLSCFLYDGRRDSCSEEDDEGNAAEQWEEVRNIRSSKFVRVRLCAPQRRFDVTLLPARVMRRV